MKFSLLYKLQEMEKIDNEIVKCPERAPREGARQTKITVIFFRWVVLLFIGILTLPDLNMKINGYAILETLAVIAIYNAAVTFYTLRNKNKINKASSYFIYFDIILLTVISYFCGGLKCDAYLFIFFIIGYCGIFNDASYTLKIGIFSAIFYTASCIFQARSNNVELEITRLAIRDFLLILGAYGISRINYEVKKYDELRKKEFRIARTDKLTGLANRHYFDQKLREEVEYADESNTVLNVLMFDLDNFKSFNDSYGHMSGDKLLTLFADIIKQ
ncbi:MAG: hypothetical protein A2Y21_12190, partial [Clostridiales bacterium GWC2_40_7]